MNAYAFILTNPNLQSKQIIQTVMFKEKWINSLVFILINETKCGKQLFEKEIDVMRIKYSNKCKYINKLLINCSVNCLILRA